jgi:ABC-2 type transport system permease protein
MSDTAFSPGALPRRSSRPLLAVTDALALGARCLRLSRRNPDALVSSVTMPVLLLLMFVYLFGGAINSGEKYVQYVVPGVLLLCAAFSSALTAVSVCQDMTSGIIDRFRSMGISGASLLAGHVATSLVRNTASAILVFGVAYLVGFRPHATPLEWLGVAGMILLFVLAMSSLAVAVGMLTKSAEAANSFTFFAMFLPYASSAFVPVSTMPTWLHGFAGQQPVTPVIETVRGLLMNGHLGSNSWQAAAWCAGIIIVFISLAAFLFSRRIA